MSTRAKQYRARRTAVRLRAVRRRLTALRQQARRAVTLGLAAAALAVLPATSALAQTGQTAMAPPTGGVFGKATAGLRALNENGPGIFYYGVNGADRGFGYQGSYMTFGGFIPAIEDDLGGFWAADLRGHLSTYGGFFSNIGMVRKQLLGGTLLGVGVYWDYDGDTNQYSSTVIPSIGTTYVFPGTQTYNQVGISGEWLTDFGNLRSNGYIPVGPTGQIIGPFVANALLCNNGINAALGGADLEVGAYVPGLADWAGMVSVGGYAFGNTAYQFPGAQAAVPWFGGVYTRLDMTLIQNWDFSLQANNDSYFDWTGFARLTYRMGGSRRRNVPDQLEQPMMRNEHIARAHQTPVVSMNPNNTDASGNPLPWQVIHVDNAAAPGGTGTAEHPFQTLAAAEAAAVSAFDIVYVHVGNSLTNPYVTPMGGYSFANTNQYLVGEGSSIRIETVDCGLRSLVASNNSNLYPIITNPAGAAINVDQPGTTVDHFEIINSNIGISDGAGFASPGVANVSDLIVRGTSGPFQRGVDIGFSTGQIRFDNVRLSNLGNDGFVVSAAGGNVTISNSSLTNVTGTGVLASGVDATVAVSGTTFTNITGTAVAATGAGASVTVANSAVAGTTGDAVVASGAGSAVQVNGSTITATGGTALAATGTDATISATGTTITGTGNPGILISGTGADVTIRSTVMSGVTGVGVLLSGTDSTFLMTDVSKIQNISQDGIRLDDATAFAVVTGKSVITEVAGNGITTFGASVQVADATIERAGGEGIHGELVTDTKAIWVQGATVRNTTGDGIVAIDSNLRVERLDPTSPTSQVTVVSNTGAFGIRATANVIDPGDMRVLVDSASITGVNTGIAVAANPNAPIPVIDFTATNNRITTGDGGTGISVSGVFDPTPGFPGARLSLVNSAITGNRISVGTTGSGILLNTVGGPAQFPVPGSPPIQAPAANRPLWVQAASAVDLSGLNNGAIVVENPAPIPGTVFSSVVWQPALIVPKPPAAPALPP